jgi:hypothetical protein
MEFKENIINTDSKVNDFSLPITASPGLPNKPAFVLSVFGLSALQKKLLQNDAEQTDAQVGKTKYGAPIFKFSEVKLKSSTDEILLDTALINISQSKNIVTTTLQGRDGTVKEYISDGDYNISIKGVIDSGNMFVYPEALVKRLKDICDVKGNIELLSPFSELLGITEAVITGYSFNQVPAGYNVQPYEITLLSDVPLIIKAQQE